MLRSTTLLPAFVLGLVVSAAPSGAVSASHADSPALGSVSLYSRVTTASERPPDGGGIFNIIAVLIGFARTSPGPVSVVVETFDGTAQAGLDYEPVSTVLVWEAGEQGEKQVFVPILDDDLFEGNEWLGVRLSDPSGATLARSIGRVVIRDDDVAVGATVDLASSASNPATATDGSGRTLTAFEAPDDGGVSRIIAILIGGLGSDLIKGEGGGVFNDVSSVSIDLARARGADGSAEQFEPVVAFAEDGGFSIAFIEQAPIFEGGSSRRVVFGSWDSDGKASRPLQPLAADLTGELWGLVAGPGGAMALFGCDAQGFGAGTIVVPPGGPASGDIAEESPAFRVSAEPVCGDPPEGARRLAAGGSGLRAGAHARAARQRAGAVPARSYGPIPVAYGWALPCAPFSGTDPTGSLCVRAVSWTGQPVTSSVPVDLGGPVTSAALSVGDRGRLALIARVAAGDVTGDGMADIITGLLADGSAALAGLGSERRSEGRVASPAARRIVLRDADGEPLVGRFSFVRTVANASGDRLILVQRAPQEAGATSEVLAVALDEDGTQIAGPLALGEARDGEWSLGLDDADRVVFGFTRADGALRLRAAAATIGRGVCLPDDTTLCLADGRYAVSTSWSAPSGASGSGRARALTANTGTFWFFDEDNVEVLLKVLDACAFNERFWLFAGGLTDAGVRLVVEDTQTAVSRTWSNGVGTPFAPVQDTAAFATCDALDQALRIDDHLASLRATSSATSDAVASSARLGTPMGACADGALCLRDRFEVTLEWESSSGEGGAAQPVTLTSGSGTFWYFDEDIVEVLVKVLDGCAINDRLWVFAAGLTDLGARLTVRDTATGELREYENPPGVAFQTIRDTDAFAGCSEP